MKTATLAALFRLAPLILQAVLWIMRRAEERGIRDEAAQAALAAHRKELDAMLARARSASADSRLRDAARDRFTDA